MAACVEEAPESIDLLTQRLLPLGMGRLQRLQTQLPLPLPPLPLLAQVLHLLLRIGYRSVSLRDFRTELGHENTIGDGMRGGIHDDLLKERKGAVNLSKDLSPYTQEFPPEALHSV